MQQRKSVLCASLLLFVGSTLAQTANERSEVACDRAISDPGLIQLVPALKVKSIRVNACTCITTRARTETTAPVSAEIGDQYSAIAASAKTCIASAIAAEPLPTFPAPVLAALADASRSDGTSPAYVKPKLIRASCTAPDYPLVSQRAQATGTTTLAFYIGPRGRPIDGEVVKSAGRFAEHKLLDVNALFALMQCDFEPATLNGKPVAGWIEVNYVWSL